MHSHGRRAQLPPAGLLPGGQRDLLSRAQVHCAGETVTRRQQGASTLPLARCLTLTSCLQGLLLDDSEKLDSLSLLSYMSVISVALLLPAAAIWEQDAFAALPELVRGSQCERPGACSLACWLPVLTGCCAQGSCRCSCSTRPQRSRSTSATSSSPNRRAPSRCRQALCLAPGSGHGLARSAAYTACLQVLGNAKGVLASGERAGTERAQADLAPS